MIDKNKEIPIKLLYVIVLVMVMSIVWTIFKPIVLPISIFAFIGSEYSKGKCLSPYYGALWGIFIALVLFFIVVCVDRAFLGGLL